jgi:4-hydroxymandelate oxidase
VTVYETGPLEERARAVLPEAVYAYYASGAGDEQTLLANVAAWADIALRPHVLRDVAAVDPSTTVLGTPVRTPVLVAPTAFHRLAHPAGETATAAGTAAAGSLLTLSTRSSVPIEEVAAVAGSWWFQVYVLADRGLTKELVARAVAAGARALVLTGDTPYLGNRPADKADVVPLELLLANHPDLARDADRIASLAQAPDVTDADIAWLAELAGGLPVVVKGVLRGDDARRCVDAGARGLVVSNHGGRQLDGAIATARALPDVVDAVSGDVEVYVDGGIRRGVDVLRALALGARAAFVGRPVLWGLAVDGGDGVRTVIDTLTREFTDAMRLAGIRSVDDTAADLVDVQRR